MGMLDDLRNTPPEERTDGEEFAQAWRWENQGDGIEGVITAISSRKHDNHPDGYPIITVRTPNGESYAIHGLVTVLKNEIGERKLRVGDEFACIYDGKKQSNNGRSFHAFRVASKPGAAPQPAQQQGSPWAKGGVEDIPF